MAADITVTFTPEESELVKMAIANLQTACAAAAEANEWAVLERAHGKIAAAGRPPCPTCGVAPEPGDPVHGGYRCNCWEK